MIWKCRAKPCAIKLDRILAKVCCTRRSESYREKLKYKRLPRRIKSKRRSIDGVGEGESIELYFFFFLVSKISVVALK